MALQASKFETCLQDKLGSPSTSWIEGKLGQLFNAKALPFHESLVEGFGGIINILDFCGINTFGMTCKLPFSHPLCCGTSSLQRRSSCSSLEGARCIPLFVE
ncbi:hypothetical protein B0H34DRAFT_204894 [Crassisporium funariophilum]|nr:hypothetical protein B0H34DRAFT_204894 [Crassisporium funariophilum]